MWLYIYEHQSRLKTALSLKLVSALFLVLLSLPLSLAQSPSSLSTTSSSQAASVNCETAAERRRRNKVIKIGVILPLTATAFPFSIPRTRPALEHARDYIHNRSDILPGYSIDFDFRDSMCSETNGPLEAIDMYIKKSADVFFGPACDYAIAPVARFTYKWGIPIVSAGALVNAFGNKKDFPLLTRVMGDYDKATGFFVTVLKKFNFKEVGFLFHDNTVNENQGKSQCWFTMESIFLAIQRTHNPNMDMSRVMNFDESNGTVDYTSLLQALSKKCRVVVLCASPHSVREIMIKAHDLNFDNGEYVFFNIELFASKDSSERPWYNASDTQERNEKAMKAYESLMTVTLRKPTNPEYRKFSKDVKSRAEKLYKNFTYGEDEVNSFVGAFHDAVLLYALALNESLEAGVSISNGSEITRRMWNRTFTGITGTVSIDENGDRNADYSLLDMDPTTHVFRVVANYFGNRRNYEPVPGVKIHWAGGRDEPPPDTPKCGFDGSKCPPESESPFDVASDYACNACSGCGFALWCLSAYAIVCNILWS